jgi:hypothetical protein
MPGATAVTTATRCALLTPSGRSEWITAGYCHSLRIGISWSASVNRIRGDQAGCPVLTGDDVAVTMQAPAWRQVSPAHAQGDR